MYGESGDCPGVTADADIFGMQVATTSDGNNAGNSSRLAISLRLPSIDIIDLS
jgi:hypothetical protein